VNFDGARALAAAEAFPLDRPIEKDFLQRYCGPSLAAVERLCAWLGGALAAGAEADTDSPRRRIGCRRLLEPERR
jgi:hypothetical protein